MLLEAYAQATTREAMRALALNDLYYLLTHVLDRRDAMNDWCWTRCREVQAKPNGYLDLWAREHYKSTIITFALTIQDILRDPDQTIAILSHTRPIAKGFLRQIKREFERNEKLQWLFPDILWDKPHNQSLKWSEDDGIIVKRRNNPKESTIEAWGLVDGQPISRHYTCMVYDDMVTRESVTTPDMIAKVTDAWALSLNLGTRNGIRRYIGTRYHYADTYSEIIRRHAAIPRIYPATTNGQPDGEPVFLSAETLAEKRREMGSYIFACQMLLDPKEDSVMGFRREDLRFWPAKHLHGMNVYIIVDPANDKKKRSDYTSMWAVGTSADGNYYCIPIVRDRLNLAERTAVLFAAHREYAPIRVGYEEYGMQADIQHITDVMQRDNYRFDIIPLGGNMSKKDRIMRLIPLAEAHRIWLPDYCIRTNRAGKSEDLVKVFIDDEWAAFPVGLHDDMLDALSRICDEKLCITFQNTGRSQHLQTEAIDD